MVPETATICFVFLNSEQIHFSREVFDTDYSKGLDKPCITNPVESLTEVGVNDSNMLLGIGGAYFVLSIEEKLCLKQIYLERSQAILQKSCI